MGDHEKVRWRKMGGFLPRTGQTQKDKAQVISMVLYLPAAAMALSINLPIALTVTKRAAFFLVLRARKMCLAHKYARRSPVKRTGWIGF